ncbi:MAG: hypothetical protein AAF841_00810 [Pseudomonadota bacterium]
MQAATPLRHSAFAAIAAALMAGQLGAQTGAPALRDLSDHRVDAAQLRSAVASRTLTWLTGTPANNDYISVGRTANFFGFVALRVSSGQSLTRADVARDTLAALEAEQIGMMAALLDEQKPPHARTQAARLEMNRALEQLRVGEGVTRDAFLKLGEAYGAAEAELGRVISQRFGQIFETLSPEQRDRLAMIRAAHVAGRPDMIADLDQDPPLPSVDRRALVNVAARFLSWTTGSPDFNDFEVVGKPSQHFGFVSLRLASGHAVRRGAVSREVLGLLTRDQRRLLDAAVAQNSEAFPAFLRTRAELMRGFEGALKGQAITPEKTARLGAEIGAIEAAMTWAQAGAMLSLRNTLSAEQLDGLLALRAKYTAVAPDEGLRDPRARGRQLFAQCVLCHAPARATAVAPSLAGIVGREIAADADYDRYSPALLGFARSNPRWTIELLDDFLHSPRSAVPGTTMGFDGFPARGDRAAILDYLSTLD